MSEVLVRLKAQKGFKKDAELARFLEIKPNVLSMWKSRGSLDYDLIFTKFDELSPSYIITGEGDTEYPDPMKEEAYPEAHARFLMLFADFEMDMYSNHPEFDKIEDKYKAFIESIKQEYQDLLSQSARLRGMVLGSKLVIEELKDIISKNK